MTAVTLNVEQRPEPHLPAVLEVGHPSGRLRRRTGLLVVGGGALRSLVDLAAAGSGREVVRHVLLPAVATRPEPGSAEEARLRELLATDTPAWRELVVADRHFHWLKSVAPSVIARAEHVWIVTADDRDPDRLFRTLPPLGRALKRTVDIIVAGTGLLVLLPVLALALLAVRLESRGPGLFRQERVGRGGRPFRLYKIRTMVTGSNDGEHRAYYRALVYGNALMHGGMFKLRNDPRITRLGRVLRRFSLDEVPQLWNVLRGDMSLVGPRPMQPHELEMCDVAVWQRLRVQPGITGLWQVSGRCRLTFAEMIDLDVQYWRSWSLLRDLSILVRTPRAVLAGDGAA